MGDGVEIIDDGYFSIGFIFSGIGSVWLTGKSDFVWIESEIWVIELK